MAVEFLGLDYSARFRALAPAHAEHPRNLSEPIGTYRIIPIILEIQSIVEQTPRQASRGAATRAAVGFSPHQPQMLPRTSL
jgi:hypothetical protein